MATLPASVVSQSPTFDEEFDTFSASENGRTGRWMTEYPYWGSEHTFSGSHEAEYYSGPNGGTDPFSLRDGVLSITASPASATGSNPLGLPYNSGLITTYRSFAQLYGYFEVKAQLPAGAGLWPAFWLASVSQQTPAELDVFEVLGDHPDVLYATAQDRTGGGGGSSTAVNVADTSAGFHTYGVDWEPQTTTFYMDGAVIARVGTPASMNVPMFMLLNLAVGAAGSWPGAPNSSTAFPASMQIDYARAYATTGTVGLTDPGPSTSPAALPVVLGPHSGGRSWVTVDVQHYGNQDAGSPQAGIGFALLDAAGKVVATSVSDGNGHVSFTGLAAGDYRLQYITPPQYRLQAGGIADTTTGLTSTFTLTEGQGLSFWNQKVESQAELAGHVEANGAPEDGIGVRLLDSSGNAVAHTTTDAAGKFFFWVPAGIYSVGYDVTPAATNSAPVSLADGQAFLLTPLQLSPAQADATVRDPALSTFRFFDRANGTQFLTSDATERDTLLRDPSRFTYEGHGMNALAISQADPNVAPVFRFFNTGDGTHFFTASAGERDTILTTRPDLIEEQANFAEHLQPQAGDTAVFRFFDTRSGDHFFTQSVSERASVIASRPDMVNEGVAFYAPGQT